MTGEGHHPGILVRGARAQEEAVMNASVGDRLVIGNPQVSGEVRDGQIMEVRGNGGLPPYVVKWSDTGHESLCFPGPDASVQHFTPSDSTK